MVKIVIINRLGETKTLNVSTLNYDELYKKCKFRKKDGFERWNTWKLKWEDKDIFVHLFASWPAYLSWNASAGTFSSVRLSHHTAFAGDSVRP